MRICAIERVKVVRARDEKVVTENVRMCAIERDEVVRARNER